MIIYRYFNNQTIDEIFNVDYSHVENILQAERKKAIDFLKGAMEENK